MKLPIPLLLRTAPVLFLLGACGDSSAPVENGETRPAAPSEAVTAPVPDAVPVPDAGEEPIRIEAAVAAERERELTAAQQRQILDKVLRDTAKQQAEGLGSGKVQVNRAWAYEGYSTLAPDPAAVVEARLVAVDVTLSGHTPQFDLDDIEIVDGTNLISYGSDPQIEPLRLDGALTQPDDPIRAAPEPSRWLLIYAFPKASPSFVLYYWGKQLTPSPISFGEGGLSLPYPSEE